MLAKVVVSVAPTECQAVVEIVTKVDKTLDLAAPSSAPWLRQAEVLILGSIAILGLATLALTEALGRIVVWSTFVPGIFATLGLIAVAAYARRAKSAHRLALCGIGIGLYFAFSAFASIFIYALYPLPFPLIDHHLAAIDAVVGYNWKDFTEGMARIPVLPEALHFLYLSSYPQLALTILVLGVLGRETALHRFLLAGMVSLALTTAFWFFWPSIGPSAFTTLPAEITERFGLATDPRLGAYLLQLVYEGPSVISPDKFTGVIAFPSFHIIMALLVFWYLRGTLFVIPAGLSGIAMIPATLAHGGHHLVDIAGGLVAFILTAVITARLIPEPKPAAVV
jgi:hypothetical protein